MRYTKHDLGIAIPTIYQQRKPGSFNKYNVLGRRDTRGNLELHLDVDFTTEERALAGKVINTLVERGQLVPTYTDTQSPDDLHLKDLIYVAEYGRHCYQKAIIEMSLIHPLADCKPAIHEEFRKTFNSRFEDKPITHSQFMRRTTSSSLVMIGRHTGCIESVKKTMRFVSF